MASQAAGDADLMGIGQHCAEPSCCQIDFLPFPCDCCQKVFCLEHRTYAAHRCPAAGSKQTEVIVCPLCAKGIRLAGHQDPNAAFEAHSRSSGCDPANYARVHKKPKCPVPHCKEKLTTINTYHCRQCNQRVCLKHRHGDDHRCAEAQAHLAQQRAGSSWLGRIQQSINSAAAGALAGSSTPATASAGSRPSSTPGLGMGSGAGTGTGGWPAPPPVPSRAAERARAAQQYADPANSVRGSAARRMQQQQQQPGRGAVSNANPAVAPHLPEVCPQCGAAFATVDRLVTHCEEYHPTTQPATTSQCMATGAAAAAAAAPSTEEYQCPHCQSRFADAVQLVAHVEQCPVARGRPVSAGSGKADCCIQ